MKPQSCSFRLRKSGVPLFMWCQRRERLPPTSLERGLKSGTVFHVMVAVKLQRRAQAPVRIELTTPGLQDQCSNHSAMKPQRCCFRLRKSGVPLFIRLHRRELLPPTSLERGLKSGTVFHVMVPVKLQRRAHGPVRIELTTPGLLDQCSNHSAKAGAHSHTMRGEERKKGGRRKERKKGKRRGKKKEGILYGLILHEKRFYMLMTFT